MTPQNPLHNVTARRYGPLPLPFRACSVDGCDRRAWKDNPYCPMHTLRARRHGDPTVVGKRGPSAPTRDGRGGKP